MSASGGSSWGAIDCAWWGISYEWPKDRLGVDGAEEDEC